MAQKAQKWLKNTDSTRIIRTEAGSFQKNWLNEKNRKKADLAKNTSQMETITCFGMNEGSNERT